MSVGKSSHCNQVFYSSLGGFDIDILFSSCTNVAIEIERSFDVSIKAYNDVFHIQLKHLHHFDDKHSNKRSVNNCDQNHIESEF